MWRNRLRVRYRSVSAAAASSSTTAAAARTVSVSLKPWSTPSICSTASCSVVIFSRRSSSTAPAPSSTSTAAARSGITSMAMLERASRFLMVMPIPPCRMYPDYTTYTAELLNED